MSTAPSTPSPKKAASPMPILAILFLVFAVLLIGGFGVYWAMRPKPQAHDQVLTVASGAEQKVALTDEVSRFVKNFKEKHLSYDGKFLRVGIHGDGPDYYGLQDLSEGNFGTAPQPSKSLDVNLWIDLSKHSLPVNQMINAVWNGNDLIAYQTMDGAFLYDLKTIKTKALDGGDKMWIGQGGCRPSFSEFSPSSRFMVINSMGETEACPIFGLIDLKDNKLIETPGLYTGLAGQSYAFEPTPQNGGEFRVFYLDDWKLNEKPDDALNFPEPHAVSVINADNGEKRVVYKGDVAGYQINYVYPNLVLTPDGRGAKEIVIKIDEKDLP